MDLLKDKSGEAGINVNNTKFFAQFREGHLRACDAIHSHSTSSTMCDEKHPEHSESNMFERADSNCLPDHELKRQ